MAKFCLIFIFSSILIYPLRGLKIHTAPPADQLTGRRSGENLMVSCSVGEGGTTRLHDNAITIEWYRDGQNKPIGIMGRIMAISRKKAGSKQLMFIKPTVEDSGVYNCKVTLKNDTAEKSVNISFIQGAEFVDPLREQHPEEGKNAEIICRVRGHSSLEIFWQFNGTNVVEGGPRGYEFKDKNQILVVPRFESAQDDGEYLCNAAQFSSFITLPISVTAYARPQITVFEGPRNSIGYEDHDCQIKCQAVGRPKPDYKWTKNIDGITESISNSEKYSVVGGLLIIRSLMPSDEGIYSCIAVNAMDSMTMNFTLSIFRRPRIEKMKNYTLSRGEAIEMNCLYSGDGTQTAKWIHQGREYTAESNFDLSDTLADEKGEHFTVIADDQKNLDTDSRIRVRWKNGGLVFSIDSVSEDDAGQYQCVVENEAGSDHSSSFLSITHAPSITDYSGPIIRAFLGSRVKLFCEVSAVPTATWIWNGPNGKIEADGSKFVVDNQSGLSQLFIIIDSKDDYAEYTCEAQNGIGKPDRHSMEIVEITTPNTPNLNCHERVFPNYGICTIGGYESVKNGSIPTKLVFFYVKESEVSDNFDWKNMAKSWSTSFKPKVIIENLDISSTYLVRVEAENEAGTSSLSKEDRMETTEAWAPAIPSSVTYDCSKTCTLSWNPPDDHGSPITEYRLSIREIELDDGVQREYVDDGREKVLGAEELSVSLPFLKPLTEYEVRLYAVNIVGSSDFYETVLETSEFSGEDVELSRLVPLRALIVAFIALLFLLLCIDLVCFVKNRCGLLACFCINCLGKNVHSVKGKGVEQENRSESNRLLNTSVEVNLDGDEKKLITNEGTHSTPV